MDQIDAMTAFVRVAERGSFTSAARDLGVSQPHTTRAVNQLETRLGARLLLRSTRRISLTEEGRDYLQRCRDILALIDEADRAVGEQARTLTGELRIFAPVSLGRSWVVPRLAEFMERHPALSVALLMDDRPRDLVEERIDVGIRVGPSPESGARVRRLGDVARVLVAAPAFWDRVGRPSTPDGLPGIQALIFDGPIRVDDVTLTKGREQVTCPLTGRLATNSSEAIHEALLLGLGYTLAPWWLVAKDVAQGRLERVLREWTATPSLTLEAVYPETRRASERVRRFIDWFVYALQADGLYLA